MASESLSRGVDLFFALEFCFIKQEHGPPRGSKQAKTDVLLTTVLGPLRWADRAPMVVRDPPENLVAVLGTTKLVRRLAEVTS